MKRTLSIALVVASAFALIGATMAFGGSVVKIETKTRISQKFPAFHGKLLAENNACVKHRRVRLYRKKSGPDEVLGADFSDNKGRWAVTEDQFTLTSGAYYAKAIRRSEGTAGTTYVCLADRSRVVIVD